MIEEPLSLSKGTRVAVYSLWRLLTLGILIALACIPSALATLPEGPAHHITQSAGLVNYMAAETQQAERQKLELLRQQPHNPSQITQQFSHSIDSFMPDGVRTSVDPAHRWTDPETGLLHHKLPTVTETQFQKLVDVTRHYATDTVAYTLEQITGYVGVEAPMTIELNTTDRIFQPARRNFSPAELEICDQKVDELEAAGTVHERRHSRYACNATLAAKRAPDGTWSDKRFCINFIPINKHTSIDCYGSHKADDLFQRVSRKKYFTALDLRSGFHQIPMDPDSVDKTSFWHVSARNQPPRLMSYSHMPFGLKNASAKFQRVMDAELNRFGCSHFAFAYIDDLLIASDTWEEHVEHVSKVLEMLKQCRLLIHPGKSVFGTNVVEYLGHNVVGEHGIMMSDAKIQAIKALPQPTDLPQLRSILGFLAYYRHFIPGFSSIAAPMTRLLQKDTPFVWGPEQRQAYEALRELMTDPRGTVLRPIDPKRELILHTDWSNYGIGAVLGQKDDEGREYLCACISRSLNKHERNYPSYKGELLALAWAVKMFRQHLHGTHFRLVTDHQPLLWLMRARDLNGQYARWQMLLQEYDFDIEHRAGILHNNADVLSRFPQASSVDNTGARLDVEACLTAFPATPAEVRLAAKLKGSSIDSFCPKFTDLLKADNAYPDPAYYANRVMQNKGVDDDGDELGERDDGSQQVRTVLAAALSDARDAIKAAVGQAATDAVHDVCADAERLPIDTGVVARSFFPNARRAGITLLELCGGIGAGVEACLLAGIRINQYLYADINLQAREVVQFRLANLSARFPDLFPPSAWRDPFSLSQDIRHIRLSDIDSIIGSDRQQVLVTAGWPCQDYSPAGLGRQGQRAALLDEVLRIVTHLQLTHPGRPVGYIFENVAMQDNFRHEHVREQVAPQLFARIGQPVTIDAAVLGSYAARKRNFWTNLASPKLLRAVFARLDCPHGGDLTDILGPGRQPMPTRGGSSEPRRLLPTLMAFHQSRAFRPGRAGSVLDSNSGQYTEPNAEEREQAMGYEPSSTGAPGLSDRDRCQLLGQAMDLNTLFSLIHVTDRLHGMGLAHRATRERIPSVSQTHVACPVVLPPVTDLSGSDSPKDIWDDAPVLAHLQTSALTTDPVQRRRIIKRAQSYTYRDGRMYRIFPSRDTQLYCRIVPKPSERVRIIKDTHTELGHLGQKRTIAALSTTYWWHGLNLDVCRVVSSCKVCSRVNASAGHEQRDMQTEPTSEFGLFHRWGLDFISDLPSSALGNKHALVIIDYFSKWVEVIPVPEQSSEITARLFVMEIVSRYGVPAEVITDNGPSFKGAFQNYCTKRGIKQRFITADVPRSNGLAERAVQTIKNALRKHAAERHNALTWDTIGLPNILLGYRCTPQSATRHPPARILFALDPVLDHEQYFCKLGVIDYESLSDEDATAQLLERAKVAAELGVEVVHNLRTAHDRDVQRFKMRRAGLYIPKIYHFTPGDFVYLMAQGLKPGGTLGIRARHEILKVLEVRTTGVLLLQNQALQEFEKHMEHCVPCRLPNMLGEAYAGLVKPPADHPCQVCKEHRHWDLMLLCDNCDAGYHTFCLSPSLDSVPEGHWICPQCTSLGVTHEVLLRKLAGYRKAEVSRPALELPSRSRIAKAQRYIDQWHGAGIIHHNRFGRVRFNGILEPKWFRIDWQDGTSSEHTAHILRHLGHVDDSELPDGVPGRPEPAVLLAAAFFSLPNPMVTAEDFLKHIQERMPAVRRTPIEMDVILEAARQLRTMNIPRPPVLDCEIYALSSVLELRYLAQMVVVAGAQGDGWVRFVREYTAVPVVVNHPPGSIAGEQSLVGMSSHVSLDPIGLPLPLYFEPAGGADMFYVNIDPVLFEVVVPLLVEACTKVVCIRLPTGWKMEAASRRSWWFYELRVQRRVLWVDPLFPDGSRAPFHWLLVFADEEEKHSITRCDVSPLVGRVRSDGHTISGHSMM
jgi:transposase InsO family protein